MAATIGAAVTGGNGGASGVGEWDQAGPAGAGGAGIVGQNLDLTLRATVTGGLGGDGLSRARSIDFTGGNNSLVLDTGWGLVGNIEVTGSLDISSTGDATLSSVIAGTGSLTKSGDTTLILTGANGYGGGTTISAGTLQLGNGGTTGSITGFVVNDGTLAFNRSDTFLFSNLISGTGNLVQRGSGMLVLTGANTYTGTTTIAASSTLQVGNNSAGSIGTGAVINNGTLTFHRGSASSALLPNAISGTGMLVLKSGTVTLTGNNTYSGGTRIEAGSDLVIADPMGGTTGSLGTGPVENEGTLVINRADRYVIPGVISGSGMITHLGSATGTLVLTGENTFSGPTYILGGATLQVGDGGTTGSLGTGEVFNYGTLAFNRADQVTYAGGIAGFGDLRQDGPGELILTSTNHTYLGATVVNGGTLTVNGSIASSSGLTVNAGGTVSGTGTLPTTVVNAGGTITPSGTGTLTVFGLTLEPGATAAFTADATGAGRLHVITSAQLNGNVQVTPQGRVFNSPYTLISAGAISGTPTYSLQGTGAGISAVFTRTATDVTVSLTAAPLVPTDDPETPEPTPPQNPGQTTTQTVRGPGLTGFLPTNLRHAGLALDAARKSGGDMQPFFGVYAASASQINQAVNQLTGEVSTAGSAMGQVAGQQFLGAMLSPFGGSQGTPMGRRIAAAGSADGDDEVAAPRPRYAMWGQAMGGYSRIAGDSGAGSASRSTQGYGFSMGLDIALGTESLVGVAVGAGETWASLANALGTSRAWTGQLGAYGRTRIGTPIGGLTLEGAAALSLLDVESKRTQYFLNGAQQRADYDARVYSFRVEARHDGASRAGVRMQPLFAVQAQVVDSDGYTERSSASGPSTGLRVAGATNSTVRTELGAQAEARGQVAGRSVRGFARLAWAHYLMREQSSQASFISLPGSGFTTVGARPDADSALMTVGVEAELAPRWTLGARLDSELSSRVSEVSGTVRLRYSF